MRARRLLKHSRLVVVALVLASGCSRDEGPAARVAPEPAPPEPTTSPAPVPDPPRAPRAAPSQNPLVVSREVVRAGGDADIGDVATPILRRLVYQCSDDVTFAVRTRADRLEVFPPGISKSYVVLNRVPSESQVRYTAPNADFRANGDLATLQVGRDSYVDCVSNPGADAWGTVQPSAVR